MEALTLSTPTTQVTRQALEALYDEHSPGMYRYAYRLTGDQDTAEDCVAETFSRFLKIMRGGRWPSDNIRAYLYRMVHNWVTDFYRRQPQQTVELVEEFHIDPQPGPAQAMERDIEQQRLRAALQRLPSDQRQVVELRFLEDWSHEQVAAALGKTEEATRALQYRAMNALKRLLSDQHA
jgi:RNA polymerase sigma-70 factor (ECF subfamily)